MSDPTSSLWAWDGVTVQLVSDADALRWLRTALDAAKRDPNTEAREREALRDGYYIVKHLLDSWEEGVPFGTTLNVIRDAESAMREALASSPGAAPDLLTRDEKVSLRSAVSCLREDYPHAAGLPHAESALRKLRATQADTDEL